MPTTTTGIATSFIDFTRASNATVTDSDGRVKWAPHNLLTNSESFDAAAWTKAFAVVTAPVVTANNVAAPNGTQTADRIVFPAVSGTNANSLVVQSPTQVLSTPHTAAVYLRGDAGGEVVWISWTSDGVTYSRTQCTLTTSWQLFTLAYTTAASGVQYIQIGVDLRDASQSAKGAQTIYAWGAHLYRSDLGGMQPNTSAYPLYNPTTPKNLLGYTEDFSNAAWTKAGFLSFGSGSTVNAILAPNGLSSADLLTLDTANSYHVIYVSGVSLAGSVGTHSIYVKPNGYTKVALRENNAAQYYASFSLSGAGSVLDNTATYATPAIAALDNGWYRISMRLTNAASQTYSLWVLPESYTTGSPVSLWTPNGTSGIYLWGAQLSDSASLDSYSPVYGAAVTSAAYYGPRRDFDGATLACKGLLVEEQRVNLQLNSNVFGTSTFAATVVAGAAASPSGLIDASSLACTSTSGRAILSTSVTSGIVYTFSVFIKAGTNTSAYIELAGTAGSGGQVVFNLSSGTVTSGTGGAIVPAPNGFYRCSVTSTATGTGASDMRIGTGDATSKTVFVYGAQLEANATFATSYIPTGAATATRNADVASVSTQAFPYSATEGTLVVAWQLAQLSGSPAAIHLTDAAESNRIRINAHLSGINRSTITAAGALVDNIDTSTAATGITKYAIGGKSADYAVYRNGSAGGTSTNAGFPSGCTEMRIGRDAATGNFNGHIRQITYIPRRLANAELQTRTV